MNSWYVSGARMWKPKSLFTRARPTQAPRLDQRPTEHQSSLRQKETITREWKSCTDTDTDCRRRTVWLTRWRKLNFLRSVNPSLSTLKHCEESLTIHSWMVNMKVFRLYLLRVPGSLRDCLPTGSLSSVGCVPHHPSSGYWLAAWSCSWVQEQLPMLLFPEIHLIHPIHSLIEGWYLHLPGIGKSSLYSGLTGEPERGRNRVFLPGEKKYLDFVVCSFLSSFQFIFPAFPGEEMFWVCVRSQLQEVYDPRVQTGVRRYREQVSREES